MTASTPTDLRERYLATWNETDPVARRALLDRDWAPGATYTDPLVAAEGLDALDATIAAVQGQFPGFVFTPAGPVDAHHDVARFGWGLGPAGAGADGPDAPILGSDVVVTDADGRIRSVVGFLDRVPAAGVPDARHPDGGADDRAPDA